MFGINAFSEPPFSLFTLVLTVYMAGLYILSFYIQTFAVQTKITDANHGSYALVILNAASMFGRAVPNFFCRWHGADEYADSLCSFALVLSSLGGLAYTA